MHILFDTNNIMAFLAVLAVLLPSTASGGSFDTLAPKNNFYENLCENVNCGKGTCKANSTSLIAYVCECEPGWKRAKNDRLNYFNFLPCLYPDCTQNNKNCEPTPSPAVLPDIFNIPLNISPAFDPCSFINCGAGTCKNISMYQHICDCSPGFRNLLNISYFPCYNERNPRYDCASAGMGVINMQRYIPHDLLEESQAATSFLPGKFHWMTLLIMSAALAIIWN
ncbi:Neurogenic locus notch-like protein [Melia azedarach]|uniref:Neurogenic locus notch-like protein n=1 Tax=Melia azedarach TaxID=155640 RepID=A0ACC1YAP8_MELAZ|nr:Neurogenic locus notch-like protein [Melia azedarach]